MRRLPDNVEAGMGRREPAASIDRGAASPVRRSTALGQAVYDVARGAAESARASRRFSPAGRALRSRGQVSQRIPEPEHLRGVRRLVFSCSPERVEDSGRWYQSRIALVKPTNHRIEVSPSRRGLLEMICNASVRLIDFAQDKNRVASWVGVWIELVRKLRSFRYVIAQQGLLSITMMGSPHPGPMASKDPVSFVVVLQGRDDDVGELRASFVSHNGYSSTVVGIMTCLIEAKLCLSVHRSQASACAAHP